MGATTGYCNTLLILVAMLLCTTPASALDFTISGTNVDVTLTDAGIMTSLKYNGEEQLLASQTFSRLYWADNSYAESNSITDLGNNQYEVGYAGTSATVTFHLEPLDAAVRFTITAVTGSGIRDIEYIRAKPPHVVQHSSEAAWAASAPSDAIFLNLLQFTGNTTCNKYIMYSCVANEHLGFIGSSAALIFSTKATYFQRTKQFILDNNLPYMTGRDGEWVRISVEPRISYLFGLLTEENQDEYLNYAQLGKFKQFLPLQPFIWDGYYNEPEYFPSLNDFLTAMNAFKAAGIEPGLHSIFGQIMPADRQGSFSNPDIPLQQLLFTWPIGNLTANLPTASGGCSGSESITLDNDLDENSGFQHFFVGTGIRGTWGQYLLVDNEILLCNDYADNTLLQCQRGCHYTTPSTHAAGAEIFALPMEPWFFINSENETVWEEMLNATRSVIDSLGVTLLYMDGVHAPEKPDMWTNTRFGYVGQTEMDRVGYRYFDGLDSVSLLQGGSAGSSSYWQNYFAKRHASFDGIVFKNKEFTRNYKVGDVLARESQYADRRSEMGWWKFHGAQISSGKWDFDATTPDDTHYAMAKTLAYDTSMGLQLSSFSEDHANLDALFGIVGTYNQLMEDDYYTSNVPQQVKTFLKNPANEAEVNDISGYNVIAKKVQREYATWDATSYNFTFTNPFGNQSPELEIRPEFSYYPFDDPSHLQIVDYADPSDHALISVSTHRDGVNCAIDNQGVVTITHTGTLVGGCRIRMAKNFDLTNKRGIGLSITGDNKGELILVSLLTSRQSQRRDYKFLLDFTGRQDIVLGDPTTDFGDYVDGVDVDWNRWVSRKRSWDYDFSTNAYADVYINNIKPGNTYSVTLHELKGLQEKGDNQLVNPALTTGGTTVTFPVTLSTALGAPYLLEYEGPTGNYNVYDENYNLLSTGVAPSITLAEGVNDLSFSASDVQPDYADRAEIRITTFDDEDRDGIPTNGDFLSGFAPCNGAGGFCDDSCPFVANPDQSSTDQDGDGFSTCVAPVDCLDSDASIHPGAADTCDNLDNDCNGIIDDSGAAALTASTYTPASSPPPVSVRLEEESRNGNTITFAVYVDGPIANLTNVGFFLHYDPTALLIADYTGSSFFGQEGLATEHLMAEVAPGVLHLLSRADLSHLTVPPQGRCDNNNEGITLQGSEVMGWLTATQLRAGSHSLTLSAYNGTVSRESVGYCPGGAPRVRFVPGVSYISGTLDVPIQCVDADGDGFGPFCAPNCYNQAAYDCNDAEPAVYEGATEYCDGLDNDCNTLVDDGCVPLPTPECGDGMCNGAEDILTCPDDCAPSCQEQNGTICLAGELCSGTLLIASGTNGCCDGSCNPIVNDGDLNNDHIVNIFDLVRAVNPHVRPTNWVEVLLLVFNNFGESYP